MLAGRLPQPNAGWSPEHRAAVLTHFDDVCAELERRGRTGRPATWFGARARLRSELLSWLDHDSAVTAAHGAEIVRSEFSFGQIPLDESGELRPDLWEPVTVALPDGRRLAMHGSADRIDRWRDGTIVVTDHKTGRDHYTKLSADDPTLDGTVFQLPAYAAAAQILAATTGPAIVRAEYSMFEKGNYARRGLSFTDEVWERVAEALGDVVEGIEAGWFPHVPDAPGFRLWIGCEHCDPDGIGTEPNWERWTAKRNDPRSSRWFAEPRDDSADDPDDPDDPDEEHGR